MANVTTAAATSPRLVMLQTATVSVRSPTSKNGHSARARVLLDGGAQRTFITRSLAEDLSLPLQTSEQLSVATFGTSDPTITSSATCEFSLILKDGTSFPTSGNVLPKLTHPIRRGAVPANDMAVLQSMSPSCFADSIPTAPDEIGIDILIRADYLWSLMSTKERVSLPSGLFLMHSRLGYVLSGSCFADHNLRPHLSNVCHAFYAAQAEKSVSDLWALDHIRITPKEDKLKTSDQIAADHLKSTLQFDESRYLVRFPFNETVDSLATNFDVAFTRMRLLSRRFANEPPLLRQYSEVRAQQSAKGITEKVAYGAEDGTPVHYLPHRPVITPLKTTTKVRIVYDASSKRHKSEPSLNDCLHRACK